MILHLTDLSEEPLQSQIIRQITTQVLSGDLAPFSPLPSIRKLASQQQVSVITVQQAYTKLTENGLIHSRRGKGFFVSEIDEKTRVRLALEKLEQGVTRPLRTAHAAGLSKKQIQDRIITIIGQINEHGGQDE